MNKKAKKFIISFSTMVLLLAGWVPVPSALAGGANPFIGQINTFGFNWAPRGWALCQGTLLAVSQNDALFSLIGTTYGGDGRTTFGLPDLRGRMPIHMGQGPGLALRRIGQKGGLEQVRLNANQTLHSHATTLHAQSADGDTEVPVAGSVLARDPRDNLYSTEAPNVTMNSRSVTVDDYTSASSAHENMPPFLVVNYSIALFGIYPSRN